MPVYDPFDEYFNDPEFRKLTGPDKIAVLSRVDHDFGQLPIKEQANVVQAYLNTPPAGKGVLETIADALGSLAPPNIAESIKADPNRQMQEKARQAFGLGHPIEGLGYTLAGEIPMLGPAAAQAGEDIGEGKTAQGLTEAGLSLGPSALTAARPIARAGGAFVKGAAKATPEAVRAAAAKYGPYIQAAETGATIAGIGHYPKVAGGLAAAGALPAVPDILRGGLQAARESWNRYPSSAGPNVPPGGLPPDIRPLYGPPNPHPSGVQVGGEMPLSSPEGGYYNWTNPEQSTLDLGPITPASQIRPVTQPTVVPPETLPSRDWRFEDARDMARLLNHHGINPADMGESEWNIAAPALKRNLGVPNDRAAQMVRQEWNKLQPRKQ